MELHALPAVEVEEFLRVDLDEVRVLEREEVGEGEEVDIVRAVYGLRDAEDGVCNRDAAAEDGGVFDVVDAGRVLAWPIGKKGGEWAGNVQ